MTQIGVKRFAAGDCEKDRAQRHQTNRAMVEQEMNCVPGIDGSQDRRVVADMNQAHHCQDAEPDHHHRTERGRDARRPATLDRKQDNEDDDRQRHDIVLKGGRRDFETFNG